MYYLMTKWNTFKAKSDMGATAVEYGLIVALIAAIIVSTVAALGLAIDGQFDIVLQRITPGA